MMTIVQFLFAVMPLGGIYVLVILLGVSRRGRIWEEFIQNIVIIVINNNISQFYNFIPHVNADILISTLNVTLKIFFETTIIDTQICYGGTFALTPAFNSERFGSKYFGMNSTIQSMAASLGSYAFSTGMAGAIYQANVVPPRTLTCHGRDCYEGTFFILSFLCCIALVFCMILQYRTKWLYSTMYRRKLLAHRLETLEKQQKV